MNYEEESLYKCDIQKQVDIYLKEEFEEKIHKQTPILEELRSK